MPVYRFTGGAEGASSIETNRRREATFLRNIAKGVAFLARRFPSSVAVIAALSVLSGATPALGAWIGKRIIDDIVKRLAAPDRTAHLETLCLWIGAGMLLGLAGIIIKWRQAVSQDWLQRAGTVEIDRILVERTREVDVLTRESPEFADRQMLVQMGTGALSSSLLLSVVGMGQTLISMASFGAVLVVFSPGLALLGICVGASFGYVELRYSRRRYSLSRALIKLRRKLTATRSLLTDPGIVHEIARPATYDVLKSRMLEQGCEARDREHDLERRTYRQRTAASAVETIISYGVYLSLVWRLLENAITLGDVNLYRSAFSTLSGGVRSVGQAVSGLLTYDLQLQHLFEFLEHDERKEAAYRGTLQFPRRLETGFRIRGLEFKYPNMSVPVLSGMDLDLRPGEMTAIVGPNGSGKTTLLKILAGIYPVPGGEVCLEGKPLAEYARESYAEHVYMWGLTSHVHPLTVRENVAICRLSESDDGKVTSAIREAGAQEIVSDLPNGVETMLTKVLDDGQQLSWGQSMRIILARAIYAGSPIMLIDEPGPGIDAEARRELLKTLKGMAKGRIVVVASHDPDVLAIADRRIELLKC